MPRGLRQIEMSSVVIRTVGSPCQAVAECWVDSSRLVVQRQRNFCRPIEYTGPRDGADVGVGRTKMTAPRVVADELAFPHYVRRGLALQRLKYQDAQLVLDSAWQLQ